MIQVYVRGNFAFLIDLTFHGHWHSFRVRCQPSCSGSFACFASHPSLVTPKGASVEVVLARRHKFFSKLCLSYVPFGPISLKQMRLHKNNNFGTAIRVE